MVPLRKPFKSQPVPSPKFQFAIIDPLSNRHAVIQTTNHPGNITCWVQHGQFMSPVNSRPDSVSLQITVWAGDHIPKFDEFRGLVSAELYQEAIKEQAPLKQLAHCYVEGTVTGTADVRRRGFVHAVLGSPANHPDPPCRLLIQDHLLDFYVIQVHPVIVWPVFFQKPPSSLALPDSAKQQPQMALSKSITLESSGNTYDLSDEEMAFWARRLSITPTETVQEHFYAQDRSNGQL